MAAESMDPSNNHETRRDKLRRGVRAYFDDPLINVPKEILGGFIDKKRSEREDRHKVVSQATDLVGAAAAAYERMVHAPVPTAADNADRQWLMDDETVVDADEISERILNRKKNQ